MKTKLLYQISVLLIAQLLFLSKENKAQTWNSLTSGTTANLHSIQFLDASNGFASGDNGTVLKTTDGGTSWSPIKISTTNPINGVSFINAMKGWAVEGDPTNWQSSGALWKTKDGGATWTKVTFTGSAYSGFSVYFIDTTYGWCGFAHDLSNNGNNLYYTTNAGASWNPNSNAEAWQWTYSIYFMDHTHGWSVGDGQTNGTIFGTTDGGVNWTAQTPATLPFMYGICFPNSTNGFAVGDSGKILGTTNGGSNWITQSSGVTEQLNGVSFISTSTGWIAGNGGKILATINGGTNWNEETSGTTNNINGVFTFGSSAWVVGDGGIILKRDITSGIANLASNNISVYPNPSTGSLFIDINKPNIDPSTVKIELVNYLGQVIETSTTPVKSGRLVEAINTPASLSPGIYFIKVYEDNNLSVSKVVINNN